MPRIPKWALLKEWLSCEEVQKVRKSVPSEVENLFALDESEELKKRYKFVCTFSPGHCDTVFEEYRFQQLAREAMRAHIKEHVKSLEKLSPDEQKQFFTKNQLHQPTKGQKQKATTPDREAPPKKKAKTPPPTTKSAKKTPPTTKSAKKTPAATKSKNTPAASKTKNTPAASKSKGPSNGSKSQDPPFTQLKKRKRKSSSGSSSTASGGSSPRSMNGESDDSAPVPKKKKRCDSPLVELKPEDPAEDEGSEDEEYFTEDEESDYEDLDGLDDVSSDEDEEGSDLSESVQENNNNNKEAGCQTNKRHKAEETLQYKMTTKLFAIDRSQWGNEKQILEDLLSKQTETLTEEVKARVFNAMEMWKESSLIYDKLHREKLSEPLTRAEMKQLADLTPEKWEALKQANTGEAEVRIMSMARLLLREYEWHPRKLKPKYCGHCQKTYTASTSLNSHLISLSGIRFWVCGRCRVGDKDEATFTRKHSLQYHILKESGIPRYECKECLRTHNHTHHRESHERQHLGEKIYQCKWDGCSDEFSNRNTYSRHLIGAHCAKLQSNNTIINLTQVEANKLIYKARKRARIRSKEKREAEKKQPKRRRTPIPLLPNKNSSNAAEDDEELMQPSASQALLQVARDIRRGGQDTSSLGGLNLLATVSNYMNVEECDPEKRSKNGATCPEADVQEESSGFTKLLDALNIDLSLLNNKAPSALAPLDTNIVNQAVTSLPPHPPPPPAPSTLKHEMATVIPKPSTVLLPLPSGRMNVPPTKQTVLPPSTQYQLPNTIENLKARLIADKVIPHHQQAQQQPQPQSVYKIPSFQLGRPVISNPQTHQQATPVQVIRNTALVQHPPQQHQAMRVMAPIGDNPQLGTSKIIISLAQKVPQSVNGQPPIVVMSKPQATMASLLNGNRCNTTSTTIRNTVMTSAIRPSLTQLTAKPHSVSLFGTSILVVTPPGPTQDQTVVLSRAAAAAGANNLNHNNNIIIKSGKTVPFSQL